MSFFYYKKGSKDSENIDKFCEEAVNDLMATIAKLDSIGVEVMPEVENEKGSSPQVHSSTDGTPMQITSKLILNNDKNHKKIITKFSE